MDGYIIGFVLREWEEGQTIRRIEQARPATQPFQSALARCRCVYELLGYEWLITGVAAQIGNVKTERCFRMSIIVLLLRHVGTLQVIATIVHSLAAIFNKRN